MFKARTKVKSADLELVGKVARLHYEYDLTHHEIAEIVHLSRVKVTRLLQQARDSGIVQIQVNSDASPYIDVESALSRELHLDEALVVPSMEDIVRARGAIARAAARYLQRILRDDMVVAISLSRTIALLPTFVADPRPVRATFTAVVGGIPRSSARINPSSAIDQLAELFGGVAEHLPAPAIVGSPEAARTLMEEPTIARAVERAAAADVVCLGLGGVTGNVKLVEEEEVTPAELNELVHLGAVGDMSARFFDEAGQEVDHELNRRVVGLSLDQIRQIPIRIVAGGGMDKVAPLDAAIRSGLISVLVTDVRVARALLARNRSSRGRMPALSSPADGSQ